MSNRKDEHRTVNLVVLYHEDDNEFKTKLRDHLSVLERKRIISIWDTAQLFAGTEFSKEINERLELADIVLFLVSSSSMASQKLWDNELKIVFYRKFNEELILIPILIRAFFLEESGLEKYQPLPKNGKPITDTYWGGRDTPYEEICKEIARICGEMKLKANSMPRESKLNLEFYELEQSFISLPDLNAMAHSKFEGYSKYPRITAHFKVYQAMLNDIKNRMKNRKYDFFENIDDLNEVIGILKGVSQRIQDQKPLFRSYSQEIEATLLAAEELRDKIGDPKNNSSTYIDIAIAKYIFPFCEKLDRLEKIFGRIASNSILDQTGPIILN